MNRSKRKPTNTAPAPEPAVRVTDRLRMLAPALSAGVLSADLMALGRDLERVHKAGVEVLHFDVMDGCFCPALTVGPAFVEAVRTPMIKDVHLMIADPLPKLEKFVEAGADIVTVQIEATRHPHRVFQALSELRNRNDPARGLLRGAALNPGTPLEAVLPLLDLVDIVFLLAVNPGWPGQTFIPSTARRMASVLELLRREKRDLLLGVDGGITAENVAEVARMGADLIVTGSALFKGGDIEKNAGRMFEDMHRARLV